MLSGYRRTKGRACFGTGELSIGMWIGTTLVFGLIERLELVAFCDRKMQKLWF